MLLQETGGEVLEGVISVTATFVVFIVHGVPGVTGVLHPGITTDVDVKVVSNKQPSIPTSIGGGRCFFRFGHVVLLPLT
jgi:hypothetical protein